MITSTSFTKITTSNNDLGKVQDNIVQCLNPVLSTPILDGILLQRQTIPASGILTLAHGLGRPAVGVLVVYASAAVSTPYMVTSQQTSPNGSVVLTFSSGAGAMINAWVF